MIRPAPDVSERASAPRAEPLAAPLADPGAEERFAFSRFLGRALRIGGIDYLNSRPLIECLEEVGGDQVSLELHVPSDLASGLRSGRLDVALVPVVECLLSPCRDAYSIVPAVGISSYGAVESILLFHRRPLGAVRRVALDATSRTSQLLTRLLFAVRPDARWRAVDGAGAGTPRFESADPATLLPAVESGDAESGADADAVLLIGDSALRAQPAPGWSVVDLGLEWTRWTGLPFVYALWVQRGEPIPGLTEYFLRARHHGLARVDRIVRRGPLPEGMAREHALRYLTRVIRYGLGPIELEGLERFCAELRAHGLLAAAPAPGGDVGALRFLPGGGAL